MATLTRQTLIQAFEEFGEQLLKIYSDLVTDYGFICPLVAEFGFIVVDDEVQMRFSDTNLLVDFGYQCWKNFINLGDNYWSEESSLKVSEIAKTLGLMKEDSLGTQFWL